MTQRATTTITDTYQLQKQTADRLGRVIVQMNAGLAWTERVLNDGIFKVANIAGIPVPNAAPTAAAGAAGVVNGTVNYAVTLYDSNRDSEGNPSATVQIVVANKHVTIDLTTITNERVNSRITHWRLYRTLGTGSTGVYFFVGQYVISTASIDDNNSDATIQANDTLLTDNDAPDPTLFQVAKAHKGYMFLVGPTGFTWSKVGNADAYPLLNFTEIEPGRLGNLITAEDSGDAFIFAKEAGLFELHFDEDPSGVYGDGYGKMMNERRGVLNKRCCVNVQGTHFNLDPRGIYVNAGGTTQRTISTSLDALWKRINWNAKDWFWGAADDTMVVFFVALDSDTLPRHAFVLDLNAFYAQQPLVWVPYEYDAALIDGASQVLPLTGPSSASIQYGMSGLRTIAVMTEHGYTGQLRVGYRDFVDPLLTAEGTVASSADTTHFVCSGATFTRTNDASSTSDVKGAFVFFKPQNADQLDSLGWSRAYRITSVSGTTITFTPAAPSALPAGTLFVIGRIPNARLHTPVFGGEAPYRFKRLGRIALEFQPGGMPFNCRLMASLDRKAPEATGLTLTNGQQAATQYEQGVLVPMGGDYASGGRLGLQTGYTPGSGFRTIQVILQAPDVDAPIVIDSIYLDSIEEQASNVP
jgi:hypothetical protein